MLNRAEHRPAIEKINTAWRQLTQSLDVVLTTAATLGGDWRLADFRELREQITAGTPDMDGMTARFKRDTVNIGVIGRTKAGKSTLLRTISGLGMEVMPSRRDKPTTAARSRIQHHPGQTSARISLYTWPEFVHGYLAPLHQDAKLTGPVPAGPTDFLNYPYQQLLDSARKRGSADREIYGQQFLDRLRIAQESFESYRGYLLGANRTLTITSLPELERFVAYPVHNLQDRPYHAVRDVYIHCPFTVGAVERLVLVDLPGEGEAALDIDKQFLSGLRNEVDLLMQVKLPGLDAAFIGKEDWYVQRLADHASMGVDPEYFVAFVINSYPAEINAGDLASAIADARQKITDPNRIQLRVGDVADEGDVRDKILGPILEHLAVNLAAMDTMAAQTQIDKALMIAAKADALAGRGAREAGRQQRLIPDRQKAVGEKAKELRNQVAYRIDVGLRAEYERRARRQEPIQELTAAIDEARDSLLKWAAAGFGMGTREKWLTKIRERFSADRGEYRDDQCLLARQQIRAEFGQIDSSISSAIERLHLAVAEELRRGLMARLVPVGERGLEALRGTASDRGLEILYSALDELIEVRAGYGSVFLRVGGPIVREIRYMGGTVAGTAPPNPNPDGDPGRAGASTGSWYDRMRLAEGAVSKLRTGVAGAAATAHPAAGVAVAAAEAAVAAAPLIEELIALWQVRDDDTPEGFHAGLTRAFGAAVDQIAELMRAEAGQLTQVLSAAADEFFDRFFRIPDVEKEWTVLCEPVCEELWPETFGPESADLAAAIARIADAMTRASAAAAEMRAATVGMPASTAREAPVPSAM